MASSEVAAGEKGHCNQCDSAHDGGAYDYDIVFLPNAVDCDCPIDRATFSRTYEEALTYGITSVLELINKA